MLLIDFGGNFILPELHQQYLHQTRLAPQLINGIGIVYSTRLTNDGKDFSFGRMNFKAGLLKKVYWDWSSLMVQESGKEVALSIIKIWLICCYVTAP
jgi:hypothetical protein